MQRLQTAGRRVVECVVDVGRVPGSAAPPDCSSPAMAAQADERLCGLAGHFHCVQYSECNGKSFTTPLLTRVPAAAQQQGAVKQGATDGAAGGFYEQGRSG